MIPSPSDIIRLRHKNRHTKQRTLTGRLSRFALGLLISISLLITAVFAAGAGIYYQITRDLPSTETLPVLLDAPDGLLLQPTRFYDRTGKQVLLTLENPATGPRQVLPLSGESSTAISPYLVNAMLSASDPDFWEHPGIHFDTLTDPQPDTIARRLASLYLIWDEPPGLQRTLREQLLALQITHQFGKEQILTWYLNTADFGKQAYGAAAAAQLYFKKPASQLSLAEAALLAAASQAPALNPIDTPAAAFERQEIILDNMAVANMISTAAAQAAKDNPPIIQSYPDSPLTSTAAFTTLVIDQLVPSISRERLYRGGYKVITTLDLDLHEQVVCALQTQLKRLETQNLQRADTSCETARLLPSFPDQPKEYPPDFVANAVVLNPNTGQILSLAGQKINGEFTSRLESAAPGSLLSPYIYLNAFTRGFSPASLVWDIPASLPEYAQNAHNPDGKFHGPARIRTALANDYLAPALQLLAQMGPENVWQTARRVGLNTLQPSASEEPQRMLLEGGNLSLLEAVHAFGAFSTQGVLIGYPQEETGLTEALPPLTPFSLIRVEDANGSLIIDFPIPQSRPVLSAQLAYLITHILSDEAARWPSLGHPNSLEIGRPAAVKTGMPQNQAGVWTIGFTPQLASGVWVGNNPHNTLAAEPDAKSQPPLEIAMGMWHAILKYASQDLPPENWTTPPGISTIEVCDPSGLLPTLDCPNIVREVFTPGSEPNQYDNLFRQFQINRETGYLATIFTPPALIETRVYLVVSPEAAAWAKATGIPTPPETYDLVTAPENQSPNAQITAPEIFDYVSGETRIRGTAAIENLKSYQVQIGQGLNPQRWLLVGEGGAQPIQNGQLALWDTRGLPEGLYAIRLQLVDAENRVQTAVTQVTVDNTPPDLSIPYPAEDQVFTYPENSRITIQVQAADNVGLDTLEFYVNENRLAVITQPPFALPVDVTPGIFDIRIIAYDYAGNQTEVGVQITVEK